MSGASYKIGMVTPFSWDVPGGVNRHVAALAVRCAAMGHQVTVIAPSDDKAAVRAARRRIRDVLLEKRVSVFDEDAPYPRFFFAGGTVPIRYNRAVKVAAAPLDLISNIDVLIESEGFDLLHVHEPFAPSLGWTALRHAQCPLVATFHSNSERLRSYWLTRPVFSRFFESFDAVIAVSDAARETAARAFPGEYRVIPGGVDLEAYRPGGREEHESVKLLFVGAESRRKGLGVLLRSLRHLVDEAGALTLDVCGADTQEQRFGWMVPEEFLGRVRFHGRVSDETLKQMYRDADVLCAPSLSSESFGAVLVEAMASGIAVVAADVPGYDEIVTNGQTGVLVAPRDARGLAQALRALVRAPGLRDDYARRGRESVRRMGWDRVAADVEAVYGEVIGRVRRRTHLRSRRQVELFADLHVHSNYSKDCTVAPRELLERAAEIGLDVLAITDHDSVAGGLEGRELADGYGVRVIVGEEVKTAEGEVIGLFLEETIPGGLSFAETIDAIKAQGGIVYVPHPFDRLHSVPSRAVLLENVQDLDVIEVFNSRIAFPGFNEQAERFALRYRLPAAAGSDAHVLPGLGTAITGMDEFSGPHDFVAALAESRIIRRRKSLLYLQSLKFLQTNLEGRARPR
jgi:glycosyltransferase involved in cell wall biosynthesis/predicted metal-dependent phosphoesterase TrpH